MGRQPERHVAVGHDASITELAGEHVRAAGLISSAILSNGLTASDGETSGIGAVCSRVGESQGWGWACDFDESTSAVGSAARAASASVRDRVQPGSIKPCNESRAITRADPASVSSGPSSESVTGP